MYKVHIAFGFHVNLYHSFREDTNDQKGFAPDIRVIRNTIKVLDRYNAQGVPVKATWDFENAFSLEEVLPVHAPDIIEDVKRRTQECGDEQILMGYNNGAMAAMTKEELEASVKWAISNENASGIQDVFGSYEPVLRPQEMMFSPSQIKTYSSLGIKALCLYYSAVPFDGFRTLIPLLPEKYAYNPLAYSYKEDSITVIPTINNGDLIDIGSLGGLARKLQKKQKRGEIDTDVFIFINMDADSEFWYGYGFPFPLNKLPNLSGIDGLIKELYKLPFVEFDTPGNYIKSHPPLQEISFTQDIADGSFDGFSSWSEKPFNRTIWTRIERARALKPKPELEQQAFLKRIRLLSTTHFGLSAPHLNIRREQKALDISQEMINCIGNDRSNSLWAGGSINSFRYCLPCSEKKYEMDYSLLRLDERLNSEATSTYSTDYFYVKYNESKIRLTNPKRLKINEEIAGYNLEGVFYEAQINIQGQTESGLYSLSRYTAEGLNGIFYSLKIKYPSTREESCVFNEIAALQRLQDDGWLEVCPLELHAGPSQGVKIIKRNYEGAFSEYCLDDFSAADPLNAQLDSFNHQITNGIVGVQNDKGGFILAAQKLVASSMAFCPMRIKDGQVFLNPFGTYYGNQRHHATHGSGLGAQAAILSAPQFIPLAPSYNGAQEEFMLGIFPFKGQLNECILEQAVGFSEGSIPPDELTRDFCIPQKAAGADQNIAIKKLTAGIPKKLQAKIMLNSLKR